MKDHHHVLAHRQVCHQVEVTWHTGRGAAAAAAAFGVVSLPAIVYQPPNCAEREKPRDDCQCGPSVSCRRQCMALLRSLKS